jgi:hypothetical protein
MKKTAKPDKLIFDYIKTDKAKYDSIMDRKKRGYKSAFLDRFQIINDKLYHLKNGQPLQVIIQENIPEFLAARYRKLPAGNNKLYNTIKNEVAGISQKDIRKFLQNSSTNQIHLPSKTAIHQPIITNRPFERIQADIVDLSNISGYNQDHRYLLNVVDHFSKFAWSFPLKEKSADQVLLCLNPLLKEHLPKILQTDNGKEFVNVKLKKVCDDLGIIQITSLPYSPQSQGLVERFNKTLKNMLFRLFTDTGNQNFTKNLASVLYEYNNSWHSTIRDYPANVLSGKTKNKVIHNRIVAAAKKMTDTPIDILKIGQYCRIAMFTLKEIRKDQFRKKYVPQWSEKVFKIVGRSRGIDPLYTLRDTDGKMTLKTYYRNELLPIDYKNLAAPTSKTSLVVGIQGETEIRKRIRPTK